MTDLESSSQTKPASPHPPLSPHSPSPLLTSTIQLNLSVKEEKNEENNKDNNEVKVEGEEEILSKKSSFLIDQILGKTSSKDNCSSSIRDGVDLMVKNEKKCQDDNDEEEEEDDEGDANRSFNEASLKSSNKTSQNSPCISSSSSNSSNSTFSSSDICNQNQNQSQSQSHHQQQLMQNTLGLPLNSLKSSELKCKLFCL